jgi:hypothetical protein
VTAWSSARIPITLDPLPGEALDSYLGAYARRLRATEAQLLEHLGLAGARAARMVVRLTDEEISACSRGCGPSPEVLRAMTLEPHDGLAVAIAKGRRRVIRGPGWRFSGSRTRYCPLCLERDAGRGPLSWRFPWSFACALHRVLLIDFCPGCGLPPAPWSVRRLGPPRPGSCTRGGGSPGTTCGEDLTLAPARSLPGDGLVLAAHRHVADLLAVGAERRPAALAELRELYALAWRAVRGLHSVLQIAPPAVHAVLDECGEQLPKTTAADVGDDALNAAVGTAVALIAHGGGHRERDAVFDWIMKVDRSLFHPGQFSAKGTGALAARWRPAGDALVGRVLKYLDGQGDLHSRVRYATAAARPRWPVRSAEQIRERAARIPAMLWPGWTMRLLPLPGGPGADTDPRAGRFRRGCAGFILLTGGPSELNFERVDLLLRTGPPGAAGHRRGWAYALRDAVERRIYEHADLTPLAATLAELAYALDEHGGPIDYARRRALFTQDAVRLDPTAFKRLCVQLSWSATRPRESMLTWYLRMLLTGEYSPIAATAAHPPRTYTQLRFDASRPVRAFVSREGARLLAAHGIDEPVTWEPDASWAAGVEWPGVDPEQVDKASFTRLLESATSVSAVAGVLGWTCEHVRLYCEVAGLGPPPRGANGAALAPARERVLAAETLRELYERQCLPLSAVARRAGCGPRTVVRLLELDGVALRGRFRRPQPAGGVEREWFEREYVGRGRALADLAAESGVSAHHLTRRATEWEIALRGRGRPSGMGHLQLDWQPSDAFCRVASGHTALQRLAFLIELPGHRDLTAAARAVYGGRPAQLRTRLRLIEQSVGFEIIDRAATPLIPTQRGAQLLREAERMLRAADPSWPGPTSEPGADGCSRYEGPTAPARLTVLTTTRTYTPCATAALRWYAPATTCLATQPVNTRLPTMSAGLASCPAAGSQNTLDCPTGLSLKSDPATPPWRLRSS